MNIYEKLRRSKHMNNNEMEKEMTIAELVRRLNKEIKGKKSLDRNVINRIESGQQEPKPTQLVAYSKVFDVSVDYILGNVPSKSDTETIKSIADYLGLSDTTIEEITNLSLSDKHIVDAIFGRTIISTNLIKTIREMLYYSHPMTKNQTCITLDGGLTMRDKDYKELENELNENEVANILAYKLFLEMRKMIDDLSSDKQLTTEIKADYEKKFFTPHRKISDTNDLPKFTKDANGNTILDIERTIYDLETKIAERLKARDMKNKTYDYKIENLCNYSDFEKLIQAKRTQESKENYLEWLRYIDEETK